MPAPTMEEVKAVWAVKRDLFHPWEGYTLAMLCQYGDGKWGVSYSHVNGSGYGSTGDTPLIAMEKAVDSILWFEKRHERQAS